MTTAEKSILQTLAYSDIFNFPLTKEELWLYLLSDTPMERDVFEEALKKLSPKMHSKSGFYSLRDNAASITERQKNSKEVQKKMRIAKRAAYYLSYIPSISLIGISGGLAAENVGHADDIDFFIITKKRTLFMTRIWIHAILEMLNLRRKRNETDVKDKICVNLLLDETKLAWPKDARDVYTAHELIQMQPLFERRDSYSAFLDQNRWVQKFLPNAFDKKNYIIGTDWKRNYISLGAMSAIITLEPFEKLAGFFQKGYMKRHRTSEVISDSVLAFHPLDYRTKTIFALNTKLSQLGLLTNK